MIPATYYSSIYLFIIMLFTIFQVVHCNNRFYNKHRISELFLLFFLILFIGLRPASGVFVDMMNYIGFYIHLEGSSFIFNPDAENKIFDNLFTYIAAHSMGYTIFFFFFSIIYFTGIFICC